MMDIPKSLDERVSFFRTLFDQSPYAMQIYSADGDVIKTNAAWDSFWGTPTSDSVQHYNIYKDKQAKRVGYTSAFEQALTGTSTSMHDVEYDPTLSGIDGPKKYVHIRIVPLGMNDQVEGVVCILEDNTEQRLAELEQENYEKRLEQEVAVRTRYLNALLQFSTKISEMSELDAVYDFLTSWTKEILKFDRSTLFILAKDTSHLVVVKTIGFSKSIMGGFFLLNNEGLPSLVSRSHRVEVVEDFRTETRFSVPKIISDHQLISAVAVPILKENELIGILIGHTLEKRIFSNSDISLCQNVANQAAVAITNTRNLRSLRRSGKRFRHLFENASDAIYLVDPDTRRIVDCNRKALLLDGYSRSEMTAKKMFELYPEEEHALVDLTDQQVVKKGSYAPLDLLHHIRKDRSMVPVEISSSLVRLGAGQLIMNIVRNASNRVALEEKQEKEAAKSRHASRMEAIGLMAGGVAHDLNNILSGVVSYPELIMMQLPEDSPIRDSLQVVMDSGQRAASVVADLLTVARGAACVKEIKSLNELIKKYLRSPEIRKIKVLQPRIEFSLKLADRIPKIECSPIHIQKILLNLITNASESIDDYGKVEIRTSCQLILPEDASQDLPAGEYAVLCVQDTGSGISQHDREHIFDPFYTTKKMGRSGTGLGLSVVWNTVQDHEGYIQVTSNDSGTCFTIFLPVCRQSEQDLAKPEKEKQAAVSGNGTILVVDDEPVQRDIATKILSSQGYKVHTVAGGEQAVSFLQEQPVDLVILDMIMDPGMNGRETFEQIIRIRPSQKAIVVSGYSASKDIKRVMELGVRFLLKKPYTIAELGKAVYNALLEDGRAVSI
jgi:PAS domain S-box-containing protein